MEKGATAEEDRDDLDGLAIFLAQKFDSYRKDRSEWESDWRASWDQYKAVSKPQLDVTEGLGGRSHHVYGLTRKKIKVMVAHVYDLLFNQGKLPFDLENTPVPDFDIEGVQDQDFSDILESQERVEGMQTLMEDQLIEAKFKNEIHSFLLQLAILGSSSIEGPLVEMKKRTQYRPKQIPRDMVVVDENGAADPNTILENMDFEINTIEEAAPQFKYRDIWDIYPDMTSEDVHEGDGLFTTDVVTEEELAEMSQQMDADNQPLFRREKILEVLNGSVGKLLNDIDLGPHRSKKDETNEDVKRFVVLTWHGRISRKDARPFLTEEQDKPSGELEIEDYLPMEVIVTFCNGRVLKFEENESPKKRRRVKVSPLIRVPGCPFGWGVARETRDANSVFDSFLRLFIDNKRMAGYIDKIIDRDRIENADDLPQFGREYKVRPGASTDNAVQYIEYPDVSNNMLSILEFCEGWGDSASGMPAFLEGADVQTSSQTAYEVSEQKGSAIKMLGIVMHYIDERILVPLFEDLYYWNMAYAKDNTLKGDFEIVAKGYTSFRDSTVRGAELRNLLAMRANDPGLAQELDVRAIIEELTKLQNLGMERFLKTDEQKQAESQMMKQANEEARQAALRDAMEMQRIDMNGKAQEVQMNHQADMEELMLKHQQMLEQLGLKMQSDEDKAILKEETERLKLLQKSIHENNGRGKENAPGQVKKRSGD